MTSNYPVAESLSVLMLASFLIAPSDASERLQGTDSERTPAFTVDGPWLLEWRTTSEFPLQSEIEIRLYDVDSGDYLGKVAEREGIGSGVRFFENPGRYQLVIIGTFVDWDILIEEIDEDRAAVVQRQAAGHPSLLDSARESARGVPAAGFQSWRPESDEQLLLFNDGILTWRVTFSPPCEGLSGATSLSFVYRAEGGDSALYDGILLENGRHCEFDRAIPARLD